MKNKYRLVVLSALTLCISANAQREARTSENTPQLKEILKRRPDSDLNQDGVLTMEEVREARKKQQANQKQRQPRSQKTPPTYADVLYGEHEAMALDFWKAESDTPTPLFVWIHGGGFRGGDKNSVNSILLEEFLKAGVSVASINYRLSHIGPYPMQMHDSARAVQFMRSKADEWNLDPTRVAAGGGSAGSGISQWLAFHEDMADPDSDDPVARQSTRLSCAVPINMQSTYDPRVIVELIPGIAHKNSALIPFYGLPEGWTLETGEITPEIDAKFRDASPINHLTPDDPPVFAYSIERARQPGNIHHPNFGEHLKEAMDKLGIECIRKMDTDYPDRNGVYYDIAAFVLRHVKTD
jgi:hypothetical protein